MNNISEKKANEKLILVDGSGYIFRAYYALPPMNNPDGIPINAVYGFTNMMVKLIEDFNPREICVLFDFGLFLLILIDFGLILIAFGLISIDFGLLLGV